MARLAKHLFLLVLALLVGIVLGIQQANEGIRSMVGVGETPSSEYFIKKIDADEVEKLPNSSFSLEEWERKEEKWNNTYQYNKYSQLGNRLGSIVYGSSRMGVEWIINKIDKIL